MNTIMTKTSSRAEEAFMGMQPEATAERNQEHVLVERFRDETPSAVLRDAIAHMQPVELDEMEALFEKCDRHVPTRRAAIVHTLDTVGKLLKVQSQGAKERYDVAPRATADAMRKFWGVDASRMERGRVPYGKAAIYFDIDSDSAATEGRVDAEKAYQVYRLAELACAMGQETVQAVENANSVPHPEKMKLAERQDRDQKRTTVQSYGRELIHGALVLEHLRLNAKDRDDVKPAVVEKENAVKREKLVNAFDKAVAPQLAAKLDSALLDRLQDQTEIPHQYTGIVDHARTLAMEYLERHYVNPNATEYLEDGPRRSTQETMEFAGLVLRDDDESLKLGIPLVERALLQLQGSAVNEGVKPEEYTRMVLAMTTNLLAVKAIQNAVATHDPRYPELPEPKGSDAVVLNQLDRLARKDLPMNEADRAALEAKIVFNLDRMLKVPTNNSLGLDMASY